MLSTLPSLEPLIEMDRLWGLGVFQEDLHWRWLLQLSAWQMRLHYLISVERLVIEPERAHLYTTSRMSGDFKSNGQRCVNLWVHYPFIESSIQLRPLNAK
jgi:hypothetical protein